MSVIKFALHSQNVLIKAMNCLFKYNGNRVQYARALSDGVFISQNHLFLSMLCEIQASVHTNDHAQSSFFICTIYSEYANDRIMIYNR